MRQPAAPRAEPPIAWPVPRWVTMPVLALSIPDSPFGWGHHPLPATGAAAEPATFGFAEPEPEAAEPVATPAPEAAAPVAADSPPAMEKPLPAPAAAAEPATVVPIAAPAAAPVVEEPLAAPAQVPAPEPEPAIAGLAEPGAEIAATAPEDAAAASETLAVALRRGIAEGAAGIADDIPPAAEPAEAAAADAARPLPRPAGATQPSAQQLRAPRPLGAPQAARHPEMPPEMQPEAAPHLPGAAAEAGLPAATVPAVMVEPQPEPAAGDTSGETAVAPRPDERAGPPAAEPAEIRPAVRNRRLYRRVKVDAGFEIDGAAAELLDISMGGFAAAKAPTLAPEMTVPVNLRLSIDGVDISTAMRARMIYCAEPRSGGRFIELTASQTALLRYIVTWRGQSVGALGTTTLLDAITRWPEQGLAQAPALPPVERERKGSWWSRALGWLRGRSSPGEG
ncbi:MAG: hypothetical protein ACM3JG_15770 [Thiohalocapsa sp.]